ncbi:MAG TPA: DUF2232 domain-containing protein [Firmicutes bacterium]|nr:DUF2232 domain-containing protein [Bacillota bacterium]
MLEALIYFAASFLVMLLFFGMTGFFMFFLIKKEVKWVGVILAGSICMTVIFAAFFTGVQKSTEHNMYEVMRADFEKSTQEVLERAEKGGADRAEIEAMRKGLETFFLKALPAWFITGIVFMVFLVYFVVRLIAVKTLKIENKMPSFSCWYISEEVMWLLLASMGVLAAGRHIETGIMGIAALNIVFFAANLYFLAGLSVVVFFMEKRKTPKFIRFMFFLLAVFWTVVSAAVILAGIFDTWFNFRKIRKGGSIWK